jgi:hypothetical protein
VKDMYVTASTTTISVSLTRATGSPNGPAIYAIAVSYALPTQAPSMAPTTPPTAPTTIPPTPPPTAPTAAPTPTSWVYDYRINCGGPTVVDTLGNTWTSDAAFHPGGGTVVPSQYVTVAMQPGELSAAFGNVLHTERYTDVTMMYNFPVAAPGDYLVTIVFVEVWHPNAATRVFNVALQGSTVLSNVDMVAEAGFQVPMTRELRLTMSAAGAIRVEFTKATGSPEGPAVYAISIAHAPPPPSPTSSPTPTPEWTDVVRINCGGPTVVDVLGRTWNADTNYQPGGDVVTPSQYTTVALAPGVITDSYGAVLATERWSNTGMGALRYVIRPPVIGTYRLQFVFAEVWHREVGTRIFDVDVQGNTVFSRLDIVAEAGWQSPILKEVTLDATSAIVTNGIEIFIRPVAGVAEGPAVYGIVLLQHHGTHAPVFAPTNSPTAAPRTATPTAPPTKAPTTPSPTNTPTQMPSQAPTPTPTPGPTSLPSAAPSVSTSASPTSTTAEPTVPQTAQPTQSPTHGPTLQPTTVPTADPTSRAPTHQPTDAPTPSPSTNAPTAEPTTRAPTRQPTDAPTPAPSTNAPTAEPTTRAPTHQPTDAPTPTPSHLPTTAPSAPPTAATWVYDYRINCGGPTMVDALGNTWTSDTRLNPGGGTIIPSQYVTVAMQPGELSAAFGNVLLTERYTGSTMAYSLPVTVPGQYLVTLVLIEVWHPNAGTRVFNVVLQDNTVLSNVDMVAEAGFQVPMTRELYVTMSAPGAIRIEFTKAAGSPEGPAVYAISVAHVPGTPAPTVAPTMWPTLPPTAAVRFTPGPQVVDGNGEMWVSDETYLTSGGNGGAYKCVWMYACIPLPPLGHQASSKPGTRADSQ